MRSRVYLSFSYSDDQFRRELRDVLTRDLRLRSVFWDDLELEKGENFQVAMHQAVAETRIMIMLVSPRYLDRSTCQAWKYEIPPAIKAYQNGELTIMWIPARAIRAEDTPFPEIQATHPLSQPLDTLSDADRQLAYENIKHAILRKLDLVRTDSFDVFLSHNSKDKPMVRAIKQQLSGFGITSWFDEDELQPGIPWQQLLEDGITKSKSVAVLIGMDGLGPWEDEEMQGALRLAVKNKRPVIPVLMPDAPSEPDLPMFLGNRTWVDLRGGITKGGLDKLVWGITGTKPNP